MGSIFQSGFLGTKAPLFMDIVTIIVAILPAFVGYAISFAKRGEYDKHHRLQLFFYIFSLIVVLFFEYGVRSVGGFKSFMESTSVNHSYLHIVLIIHIIIATLTTIIWTYTIVKGKDGYKINSNHKKWGIASYIGIILTAFTGIWVYLLLFVF